MTKIILDGQNNVCYNDIINYRIFIFFGTILSPEIRNKKGGKMLLGEVAEVRTGLVLSRKKAPEGATVKIEYKALNLKCVMQEGYLNLENIEEYNATERLKPEYLTNINDILVRLSAPYTAVFIADSSQCGYVIPSHFAIVRADETKSAPEYLNWFLKRDVVKQNIMRNVSGSTAFGTISSGFIANLEIRDIPIAEQKMIGDILLLAEKEQELLRKLADNKAAYSKAIVNEIYDRIKRGNKR